MIPCLNDRNVKNARFYLFALKQIAKIAFFAISQEKLNGSLTFKQNLLFILYQININVFPKYSIYLKVTEYSIVMKGMHNMNQSDNLKIPVIERVCKIQSNLSKLNYILINDKKLHDQAISYLQKLKHHQQRDSPDETLNFSQNSFKQRTNLKTQEFQQLQQQSSIIQISEELIQKDNIQQYQCKGKRKGGAKKITKQQVKRFSTLPKDKQKSEIFLLKSNKVNLTKLSSTKSQKKLIKRKQRFDNCQLPQSSIIPKNLQKLYKKAAHKSLNSTNGIRKPQLKALSKMPQNKQNKKQSCQREKANCKINFKKQSIKLIDLNTKKALCQAQATYISSALKLSKKEFIKISQSSKKSAQQCLLRIFCIKCIKKFFNQFCKKGQNLSSNLLNENNILEVLKDPEGFIAQLLELPEMIRQNNRINEKNYKQASKERSFLQQKLKIIQLDFKSDSLFSFTIEMFNYVQFLIVNDIARLTNRSLAESHQLNSDRKYRNSSKAQVKQRRKWRELDKRQFSDKPYSDYMC